MQTTFSGEERTHIKVTGWETCERSIKVIAVAISSAIARVLATLTYPCHLGVNTGLRPNKTFKSIGLLSNHLKK